MTCVIVLGVLNSFIADNFFGLSCILLAVTMCPRCSNSGFRSSHLSTWSFSPVSLSRWNTMARLRLCSSMVLPKIIMSSKYTKQCRSISLRNAVSIMHWKVAWAFFNPNGMRLYWKWPSNVEKAVYFLLSVCIGIWWNPEERSRAEKKSTFPRW